MEYVYTTIELIKEWQRKIENYSGIECINLRALKENANLNDYQIARITDAMWFEGFVNELQNLI